MDQIYSPLAKYILSKYFLGNIQNIEQVGVREGLKNMEFLMAIALSVSLPVWYLSSMGW